MPAKNSFVYSPIFVVLCFILVLMFALGFSRMSLSNDHAYSEQLQPLLVEVMGTKPVHAESLGERYVGRVEAGQRAEVGFDISGVITSVLKSEGDNFKKGELLATLDIERLLAKQKELDASLTRATAAKKLAKSSLERAQSLKATRSISDQALDEAIQNRDAAEAEYDLVLAQRASIDVELKKAKLFAPFDGVVIDRLSDVGRVTNPGAAILLLEELGKTEIRVGFPLKEARQLKVGQRLLVKRDKDNFVASIDRINLALSSSRVSEVYLLPEKTSVAESSEFVLPLISGELVHVMLEKSQEMNQGLWLPLSALSEYGRGLWSVYVAQPNDMSDKTAVVARAIVEVMQVQGEYAQVQGGISESTLPYVVKGATHRVVDGQKVRLAPIQSELESAR